jgi:hypothetical protein
VFTVELKKIHAGKTTLERWGNPYDKYAAFITVEGKRVVVHGDVWWKLFDAIKSGNTIFTLDEDTSHFTFTTTEGLLCSVASPLYVQFFKAFMEGKRGL